MNQIIVENLEIDAELERRDAVFRMDLDDEERRSRLKERIKDFGRPQAAQQIVEQIANWFE